MLSRPDGLYVLRLDIDTSQGFNSADLDELAFVAGMVAKRELGHTHYHHNMPGKGRASKLKPSQILYVTPVHLQSRGWATNFRRRQLGDAQLRASRSLTDIQRLPDPLLELRHRYVRVEDAVAFRVRRHRKTQGTRHDGPFGWATFLAFGVMAALLTFLLVLPKSLSVEIPDVAALLASSVLVAIGARFWARLVIWDIPVIRLLRTAHGFFVGANPLNKVVSHLRGGPPLNDFADLLANLQSRIEGEQHRIAMGQNWMAASLGAASLVAGVWALQPDDAPSRNDARLKSFQDAPPAKADPPPDVGARRAPGGVATDTVRATSLPPAPSTAPSNNLASGRAQNLAPRSNMAGPATPPTSPAPADQPPH